MTEKRYIPCLRSLLIGLAVVAPQACFAGWYIDASTPSKWLGGPSRLGPYSTRAQAEAVLRASPNYGLKIIPGGFDDTGSGGGSTFTPTPTGNFTPQQQLMLQGASIFGQMLGNELGKALRGPSAEEVEAQRLQQEEAARRAAELERQRQEQQKALRIATAASLRVNWDGRDRAMSQELSGVFDLPVGGSTPFFGAGGTISGDLSELLQDDTSTVDLRDTAAGGSPNTEELGTASIGIPSDSTAVSISGAGIQMGTVDSNFFNSQKVRAQETQAFSEQQWRWNSMPALPRRAPTSAEQIAEWQAKARGYVYDKVRDSVSAELKSQLEDYAKKIPGYDTLEYFKGLNETREKLMKGLEDPYGRILEQDFATANRAVVVLGSGNLGDDGLIDRNQEELERQAKSVKDSAYSMAKDAALDGYKDRRDLDEELEKIESRETSHIDTIPINNAPEYGGWNVGNRLLTDGERTTGGVGKAWEIMTGSEITGKSASQKLADKGIEMLSNTRDRIQDGVITDGKASAKRALKDVYRRLAEGSDATTTP